MQDPWVQKNDHTIHSILTGQKLLEKGAQTSLNKQASSSIGDPVEILILNPARVINVQIHILYVRCPAVASGRPRPF